MSGPLWKCVSIDVTYELFSDVCVSMTSKSTCARKQWNLQWIVADLRSKYH